MIEQHSIETTRAVDSDTTTTPLTVTEAASERLRQVMVEKGLAEAGLRVFVSGGGCSGLQYGMAFEKEGEETDHVFTTSGLTIFVDPISIGYLQGANIDYVDSLMGGGFKIDNPNAVASCGCGNSFKPEGGAGAVRAVSGGGCSC